MSAEDLKAFGMNLLSEYAAQEAKKKEAAADEETFLTANQVCELLHVDRSTLWRWKKEGYLIPANVGSRMRYGMREIKKVMEERR